MENHAVTHCFGDNFRPISFTSEECNLYPLLPEYAKQINVPIFTGVTELILESGEVKIMDFVQDSWFGNRMEKSMINPNQCQKFGIQIRDNLTNPHRNLVTETSGDMFIPMKT